MISAFPYHCDLVQKNRFELQPAEAEVLLGKSIRNQTDRTSDGLSANVYVAASRSLQRTQQLICWLLGTHSYDATNPLYQSYLRWYLQWLAQADLYQYNMRALETQRYRRINWCAARWILYHLDILTIIFHNCYLILQF